MNTCETNQTHYQTLLGVGWAKRNGAPILQLEPGTHRFPFQFKLPLPTEKDASGHPKVIHPSSSQSWVETQASITYPLKASVDLANSIKTKVLSAVFSNASSEECFVTNVPVGGHSILPEEIGAAAKAMVRNSNKKEFMFQKGELSVSAQVDRKVRSLFS